MRTVGTRLRLGSVLSATIVFGQLTLGYALAGASNAFDATYRELHSAVSDVDATTDTPAIAVLIGRYEQLIDSSLDVRGVERAMYDCARLHVKNRDRAGRPIGNSLEESIRWCREVLRRTAEGTELWFDANSMLVARLQKQNTAHSLREARSMLESIAVRVPDGSSSEADVKRQMISQCLHEGDFDTAAQTCRELLNWRGDGSSGSIAEADRRHLHRIQLVATNTLLSRLVTAPMSAAAKKEWLAEFASEFKHYEWLEGGVALAQRRLERRDMPDRIELTAADDLDSTTLLVLVNVVFLAVLAAALGYYYRRSGGTT